MSFKLTTIKNTRDMRATKRSSSVATTVDYLYTFNLSTGALEAASASTDRTQILFKANESATAGTTPVSTTIVAPGDEFLVDSVNNSNSAHNGQRMLINATGDKLTNSGTDVTTGVFVQVDVVGAAADKKILARHV